MNFYKNIQGDVYAFDREAIKDIIVQEVTEIDENGHIIVISEATTAPSPWVKDLVKMTDEEVELHITPAIPAEEKIIQRLARLQRIYTKQSVRITAIQINQEGSTDSEYIKAQLSNYELRYSLAKYTLNDVNATEEDKLIANAVIQASESASIYVSHARMVIDVIRRDLTIAINDGIDIDGKLDILDNVILAKDGISKEKIDLFLASFSVARETE